MKKGVILHIAAREAPYDLATIGKYPPLEVRYDQCAIILLLAKRFEVQNLPDFSDEFFPCFLGW